MEVLKMENKHLTGGLCPSSVDPIMHRVFRERYYTKNNTLQWCIYKRTNIST